MRVAAAQYSVGVYEPLGIINLYVNKLDNVVVIINVFVSLDTLYILDKPDDNKERLRIDIFVAFTTEYKLYRKCDNCVVNCGGIWLLLVCCCTKLYIDAILGGFITRNPINNAKFDVSGVSQ